LPTRRRLKRSLLTHANNILRSTLLTPNKKRKRKRKRRRMKKRGKRPNNKNKRKKKR
jgi:hypothetical protein